MKTRFSKEAMTETLRRFIAHMEKTYGFDPHNGWDQVRGKGEEINREYGRYAAYLSMLDTIEGNYLQSVTK